MMLRMFFLALSVLMGLFYILTKDKYKNIIEQLDKKEYKLLNFIPSVLFLIEDIFKYNYNSKYDSLNYERFIRLYGKKYAKNKLRFYYAEKISLILVSLFILNIFCFFLSIQNEKNEVKIVHNSIKRPVYEEENKTQKFSVTIEKNGNKLTQDIDIEIKKKEPIQDKINNKIKSVKMKLDNYFNQNNKVASNVYLPTILDGVSIKWYSNNPKLMNEKGEIISNNITKEGKEVILTSKLSYYTKVEKADYKIIIIPPTELTDVAYGQKVFNEIVNRVNNDMYLTEDKIILPQKIKGMNDINITWSLKKDNGDLNFYIFGIVVILLLFFIKDEQIKKKIQEKEMKIRIEFPDFINKFTLLINAGMTVSKSWNKMVNDYCKSREHSLKEESPLYEEMALALAEFKRGIAERQVYEIFGARSKIPELKKFANILVQNLKRGNDELVSKLRELGNESWQMRKITAKKQGEEASTKLLFPMLIMFIVIVIIVIAPAMFAMKI